MLDWGPCPYECERLHGLGGEEKYGSGEGGENKIALKWKQGGKKKEKEEARVRLVPCESDKRQSSWATS